MFAFPGFLTGDDVEILQTAARRAYGLEYPPWEIRNLLLPDLVVAPFLAVAGLLGVHSPQALIWIGHLPFVLLTLVNVGLVYAVARRLDLSESAALVAAGLYASLPLVVTYGSSAYPRVATTACLLASFLLVFPKDDEIPARALLARDAGAGGLLALAVAFRYSAVVLLAAVALWIAISEPTWRRRLRRVSVLGGAFLLGILITVGLWDQLTWGRPFSSLVSFFQYTLVEQAASSRVVDQPASFYLRRLPHWLPVTLLPLLFASPSDRRRWVLWAGLLTPLLLLSLIHHKQIRYLQPVLPWVALLATLGAVRWWRKGHRRTVAVLLLLAILFGVVSGVRRVQDKSTAAIQAARSVAVQNPRVVALSQPWAYGHRLYFGNDVEILDLGVPPSPDALRTAAREADVVGLYPEDLDAHPEWRSLLERRGFTEEHTFSHGRSREVVVFQRPGGEDSRSHSSGLAPFGVSIP